MTKIDIRGVSERVHCTNGFNSKGCYGSCSCQDACCRTSCDVDLESYELIFKHRDLVEPLVGMKIEECFEKEFSPDQEFLGGKSIGSKTRENGFCIFHHSNGKGCVLYELAFKEGVSRRIVPSICRLFPITWDKGTMLIYNEVEGLRIPETCNIFEREGTEDRKVLITQKIEIEDIFNMVNMQKEQTQ